MADYFGIKSSMKFDDVKMWDVSRSQRSNRLCANYNDIISSRHKGKHCQQLCVRTVLHAHLPFQSTG